MKTITISLPEDVEPYMAKMILAAALFDKGILSSGQAAEMVGVTRRQFLEEVGKFNITIFGETLEDLDKLADNIT